MTKDVKVVFSSDWHIGLKTDDIDRTEEIIHVGKQVVAHCKRLQKDYRVILVLGGDIFNVNSPTEAHITAFIGILNLIRKYSIETYVMVGNHDSVPDPDRSSCLSFVRRIGIAYPTIKLIDDIKFLTVGENDVGPIYFTFLPHITRALVHKKIKDGKYTGGKNTQEYIEKKSNGILKKLGKGDVTHYVFSHLNVIGAHPGSEENLLKKSEVYLPKAVTTPPMGYTKPDIIQGHIHSQSVQGNIHIIGSPIFCSFGESGPKYFAEITINHCLGFRNEINLMTTDCRPFMCLDLDMMGMTGDFYDIPQVKEFLVDVLDAKNPVVKFDITIDPDSNTYDWESIRRTISGANVYVKPIFPRVVIKRVVRSIDQKINLPIKDKIKVYLKKNLRADKNRAKRIYKRTQKYLEA